MTTTVIEACSVSKTYRLYNEPIDRLKESLHPLRKKYHREFCALDNVSFTISRGETVGIIGRNGSGKSTLLKLLTRILTPTSGSIETHGRVLALLELGAGFNPELSGLENIYFNGALLGLAREEIDAKLEAILAFADIGDFVHQPVRTYSSGMVVRLAFAVIANMEADILVIDEALSVGDAFFVQKCMRFLRKFIESGTLIFVSHDIPAVVNLCSRAIWLSKGKLVADASPKAISEAYLAELLQHDESTASPGALVDKAVAQSQTESPVVVDDLDYRDMRLDLINTSKFRNDIELFEFSPEAESFGAKGAEVKLVTLEDTQGRPLNWVVGGEMVSLLVQCIATTELFSPIVGFYLKDRLGQTLFGENTCNFCPQGPLTVHRGQAFTARFTFRMPILPKGDYSVTVAIAEGTQESHVQHHWIHDALLVQSHSSSLSTGLIGVPMQAVELLAR